MEGPSRNEYICWEDYFMGVAFLAAHRSKDPVTQVGACIVDEDKKIVGIGYNGMPTGLSDDKYSWGIYPENNNHLYVCHAEVNAIVFRNTSNLKGCAMYVSLFPCNACAKVIIQAGIKQVFYYSDKHAGKKETIAAKKMFNDADVKFIQYIPKVNQIVINFEDIN